MPSPLKMKNPMEGYSAGDQPVNGVPGITDMKYAVLAAGGSMSDAIAMEVMHLAKGGFLLDKHTKPSDQQDHLHDLVQPEYAKNQDFLQQITSKQLKPQYENPLDDIVKNRHDKPAAEKYSEYSQYNPYQKEHKSKDKNDHLRSILAGIEQAKKDPVYSDSSPIDSLLSYEAKPFENDALPSNGLELLAYSEVVAQHAYHSAEQNYIAAKGHYTARVATGYIEELDLSYIHFSFDGGNDVEEYQVLMKGRVTDDEMDDKIAGWLDETVEKAEQKKRFDQDEIQDAIRKVSGRFLHKEKKSIKNNIFPIENESNDKINQNNTIPPIKKFTEKNNSISKNIFPLKNKEDESNSKQNSINNNLFPIIKETDNKKFSISKNIFPLKKNKENNPKVISPETVEIISPNEHHDLTLRLTTEHFHRTTLFMYSSNGYSAKQSYNIKRQQELNDFTKLADKSLSIMPHSQMGGVLGFTYLGENFMALRDDLVANFGSWEVQTHEAIHTPDEYETRILTKWMMEGDTVYH